MHEIGHHSTVTTFLGVMNSDTIIMTWIVMAIVLILAILATRKCIKDAASAPSSLQCGLEMIFEWLDSQVGETLGRRGEFLKPFFFSLFLFLLVSNWLGLVPGFKSPTSDLNTTLGLALMVIVMVHVLGLYFKGTKYIKHFFQPYFPFVIINIIEEIAKPITLAFRLFGNIMVGEVLIIVLVGLIPHWMPIPSVVWIGFSMFIGVIQAIVFTMLSIAYLANAVAEDDEH